jgi:hypothetical protein
MDRINRSFALVGQSFRLLMQDKELVILPLMSGIVMIVVVLSFFVAFFDFNIEAAKAVDTNDPRAYLPLFLFYTVTYFVGTFFQAAVVAGAMERMRGGDPTVSSALGAAGRHVGKIFGWALLAATVGTILRAIADRVPFVGKIVIGLIGAAWSIATFFVVPVLVLEDLSVTDSVRRSTELLKRSWGEAVVGTIGLGAASFVAWLGLIAVAGTVMVLGDPLVGFAIGAIGAIGLVLMFSALQGVYLASLYQYASGSDQLGGFDRGVLASAFQPKK